MSKHKSTPSSAGRSGVQTASVQTNVPSEKQSVSRRPVLLAVAGCFLAVAAFLIRFRAGDRESQLRSMQTEELIAVSHLSSDDAVVHRVLGDRLVSEKRVQAAKNEYDTSVRLAPSSAANHLGLGNALVILNQRQEAEEQFTQALKLDPEMMEAERALGSLMASDGRSKEALAHLSRATETQPKDAENWYRLALCQNVLNRPDEAITSLQRAIQLKENSAEYHTALGEILSQSNQGEAALQQYEKALQIDPNYGEACAQAGKFLAQNTQSESGIKQAEDLLTRATKQSTKRSAEVWFVFGQLYLQTGRASQAVDALSQSIRLEPRDERFFYALANAYRRQNRMNKAAEAEKQFHRISELHLTMDRQLAELSHNPDATATRVKLARTYRDLGLIPQAIQQYTIALRLMPENTAVKQEVESLMRQASKTPAAESAPPNATQNTDAPGRGNADTNR